MPSRSPRRRAASTTGSSSSTAALWQRDVLGGSLLAPELKAHLRDQLARLGHARLLFVKRPDRRGTGGRQLFFGCSRPGEERLYALEFERHDDLLELDLAAALAGKASIGMPVDHPLFVVCTHGKRDRCCAKYGQPLYDELLREDRERAGCGSRRTWAATASPATSSCSPRASTSGASTTDDVRPLLDSYAAGRLVLERYRGRSRLYLCGAGGRAAVRATERAARASTTWPSSAAQRNGESGRCACETQTGAVHEVDVVEERSEEPVLPDVRRRHAAARASLRRGAPPRQASLIRRNPSRTRRRTSTSLLSSSSSPGQVCRPEGRVRLGAVRDVGSTAAGKRSCFPSKASTTASSSVSTSAMTVGRRSTSVSRRRGRRARAAGSAGPRAAAGASRRSGRACAWPPRRDRAAPAAARPAPRRRSRPAAPSRRNSTSSAQSASAALSASIQRVDVDPDREVERIGLRRRRLVQPAARKIERVAGAQRRLVRRLARRPSSFE